MPFLCIKSNDRQVFNIPDSHEILRLPNMPINVIQTKVGTSSYR